MSPHATSPRRRARLPAPASATWIAARASNVLRRPVLVASLGTISFVVSLLALVLIPQQARRTAASIARNAPPRPDTEPTFAAELATNAQLSSAENALRIARETAVAIVSTSAIADVSPTTGTIDSSTQIHRDTLLAQIGLLSRLIARSQNAPLLGSYRSLAQSLPMQGDGQVRMLLDSLVEIERERDSYSAVGGVDPVFVALTARANDLGRSIEGIADAKLVAMKREIAKTAPTGPVERPGLGSSAPPDTMERLRARDLARNALATIQIRLANERGELTRLDAQDERARELSSVGASPLAMLAAALVFALAFGFGASLMDEVKHPRLANAREVERATGARVLGVISERNGAGESTGQRSGMSYIDSGADGHQLVYQAIATAGVGTVMLTISGDNDAVNAIVAINFAAIASDEARATLLIETNSANAVSAALRLRSAPGIAELVEGSARWSEATRMAHIGKERSIDVVPNGKGKYSTEQLAELMSHDAPRLFRQYDAVILASGLDQVCRGSSSNLPVSDVALCARVGKTTLAALKHSVLETRRSGARVRGVVLWNAVDPQIVHWSPDQPDDWQTDVSRQKSNSITT